MKKILCLVLCLVLLLPTVVSCSKAPEYAEIEERFKELIEASYEINEIFFGVGLATYERVTDPKSKMQYITKTSEEDPEKEIRIYYYELEDPTLGRVVAFRSSYLEEYRYLEVKTTPDAKREAYYEDTQNSVYCYLLTNYSEPSYEFFYDEKDPTDYDYVRLDCGYGTIVEMKEAAAKVYSAAYLESIYDTMFVGTAGLNEYVTGLSARYMEYADPDDGTVSLMKSNTFEPLVSERRIFDFSTAKIVRPKNKSYVTIQINSYLESAPQDILTLKIGLVLQDGQWMLDSATY